MKTSEQHYNIMSSCDEGLLPFISVLLYSIASNLNKARTDFYLMHRGIAPHKMKFLYDMCETFGNLSFHDIIVPDADIYDYLAKYGGGWAGEAYYSLCAHHLLPDNIDRILYLDAGDTFITGDISAYYNCDFEGKSLLVTGARYKASGNTSEVYGQKDMEDAVNGIPNIVRGLFNSGSYIINVNNLRNCGISLNDYQVLVQTLRRLYGEDNTKIYWGDQGLLSLTFAGDIKYFDYPLKSSIWYMPYNFCMWYYDRMNMKPDYIPAIVHFAGGCKPWEVDYPIVIGRYIKTDKLYSISEMKIGQAEYYYQWHEYAILTDRLLSSIGY